MQMEYHNNMVMKDKTSEKVFKASYCNKLQIVVFTCLLLNLVVGNNRYY